MKKCDIIIPVYKSPEWVKLCVYSLFKNTSEDCIGNVYLINDCDDPLTINCLNNLKEKYSKIVVLKNKENLGFVKTTNRGMKESKSDYVLLLNTDCIISKNTISKLMNHCEKNKRIGLICPISSNAANLTLDMFEGFSFMEMNQLLEKKFMGKTFDACTVVGNCLMITRECIKKVGYLDEIYGTGYGEETDYQFKAMEQGFEAKVAIDTYVFHKSEASFGNSKEKQEHQEKNAKIFFDRWGNQYHELMEKYQQNDPIKYINSHITEKDKEIHFNFLIYLIGFSQTAGGIHTAVDIVNYMSINNYSCNVLYSWFNEYSEILLFKPLHIDHLKKFTFDKFVCTFNTTAYYIRSIANEYHVPVIYYAQGYEPYFYNGREYAIAELSYKLTDDILTISDYLKNRYQTIFHVDSTVIANGIHYDLFHRKNKNKCIKTITFMLRNDTLKGDFLLLDIIKAITNKFKNLELNVLYNAEHIYFPKNDNDTIKINYLKGPFQRKEIATILQSSDLFIDASLTEGFGLMALEAMTAGNIAIVSNSGGINEYLIDGKNGFIINEVNNINKYIEKIELLLQDHNLFRNMMMEVENTCLNYDYDYTVEQYIHYFNQKFKIKQIKLDDFDTNLYNEVLDKKYRVVDDSGINTDVNSTMSSKKRIYKVFKIIPKKFRIKIKNGITKLYHFTCER